VERIAVISQESSGDPQCSRNGTGRTAGLEADSADFLEEGDFQDLPGPFAERGSDIFTLFGADTGPTLEDISTITADDVCCRAWGGQAAQLFRADRYPGAAFKKF